MSDYTRETIPAEFLFYRQPLNQYELRGDNEAAVEIYGDAYTDSRLPDFILVDTELGLLAFHKDQNVTIKSQDERLHPRD